MKEKQVLVIEDDRFLLKAYDAKLSASGFEVHLAHDGVEAMEFLKKNKPDIILLDLVMPRMDGFDVLKAVQKENALKKIPIIILTNLGQESDKDRGMELGAVDYIVKSDFSLQQIVDLINKHLKS